LSKKEQRNDFLIGNKIISMIKLPKDLQKQNFYDALKNTEFVPGSEILDGENLLALKYPEHFSFIGKVWAEPTNKNIVEMKKFFRQSSFFWFLTEGTNDSELLQAGFIFVENFPEMLLDLNKYQKTEISQKIKIIKIMSDDDFMIWSKVAAETFQCKKESMMESFYPLVDKAGGIAYSAFYENEPAATALVYCYKKIAGIYAMSTKDKLRRSGLGQAAAQACIEEAKNFNSNYATLYASQQGEFLYKKMGFQITQRIKKYFFQPK